MKNLLKPALLGLTLISVPQAALAQQRPAASPAAPSGPIVPGLAVASLEAVITNSNAFRAAQQQRPVTYKAQIDAAEARRRAIAAQLQPLVDRFNRDRAAASPNQASLQQQAAAIQRIQESGQQELQRLLQPAALSEAYVTEQVEERIDQAVRNAMTRQRISMVLSPQAVVAVSGQAYNLNQAILNELNTLIPSAQLVPPQGWEPREIREARAAQAAQQGTAPAAPAPAARPAARPAGPQPEGR